MNLKYSVGSLFSGIGAFDLGFHSAGFKIAWQCDFDPYCQQLLKARQDVFGKTGIYGDIRDLGTGRKHEPQKTDVLIGGFPCQPFSLAGKRKGEDDSRNVWGEFARLIGDLRPRAIMLENVPAVIMGGYGWTILADLTALGYDTQWGIISALDAGASHIRDRWWLVGYASRDGLRSPSTADGWGIHDANGRTALEVGTRRPRATHQPASEEFCYADGTGLQGENERKSQFARNPQPSRTRQRQLSKSGLVRANDGTAYRVDGHRFPFPMGIEQHADEAPRTVAEKTPHWKDRVKALGNAGLPQIAYYLALGIKKTLEAQDAI